MEMYKPTRKEFILSEIKNAICQYVDVAADDFEMKLSVVGEGLQYEIASNGKVFTGGVVNGYKPKEESNG